MPLGSRQGSPCWILTSVAQTMSQSCCEWGYLTPHKGSPWLSSRITAHLTWSRSCSCSVASVLFSHFWIIFKPKEILLHSVIETCEFKGYLQACHIYMMVLLYWSGEYKSPYITWTFLGSCCFVLKWKVCPGLLSCGKTLLRILCTFPQVKLI